MIESQAPIKNRVGRPSISINPKQVKEMRSQGLSWREIAKELQIGTATAMRLLRSIAGTRPNIQNVNPQTTHGS
jgi:orotate phosphoribosyltransferase-like protein